MWYFVYLGFIFFLFQMIIKFFAVFIKANFYLLFFDADTCEHQKFIENNTFDYK